MTADNYRSSTVFKLTGSQEAQKRAVNVVAVPLPLNHKVNHPEVAALDDKRAAGGGEGLFLHRCYVVVQNLHTKEERVDQREGEKQKEVLSQRLQSGLGSALFTLDAYANVASLRLHL